MDVTGTVTSLSVSGGGAAVRTTATVTGTGAGPGRPLHGDSHRRRSGATVLLTVFGLTFHEILTDGYFDVSQGLTPPAEGQTGERNRGGFRRLLRRSPRSRPDLLRGRKEAPMPSLRRQVGARDFL
jgi:hypothetical protein